MASNPVVTWLAICGTVLLTSLLSPAPGAYAQDQENGATGSQTEPQSLSVEKPTPYDSRLARLSEIIGAVQYLRNLCSDNAEPGWREAMQALIDAEAANEPTRKARLVSAYNRGYRSFASVYTRCTPAAVRAETSYRNEGATLATEITARYGN